MHAFKFSSCQTGFRRVLLCMTMLTPLTCAGTALEEKVIRAPMPHTQLANSGPTVTAHYVRVHSDVKESNMDKQMAATLKTLTLGLCEAHRRIGKPAKPPREFPRLDLGVNEDTYVALNRVIKYKRQYSARVDEADCSLIEEESFTAELESYAGSCTIDLIARTAEGQCDLAAHAAAAPMLRLPETSTAQEQYANMAADPRTAAAAASLKNMLGTIPGKRARKRVLGIECEVVTGPGDLSGCMAIGGSFQSAERLILESRAPGTSASKAVEAALDAQISAAVFAPHAGKGFTLKP